MDLSAAIRFLGETLGKVLRTEESVRLFETEERIRALAKARRAGDPGAAPALAREVAALSTSDARGTASAFAVYFDLVNQRSIRLRNPYVDPLNYVQVEMLRRLRALIGADTTDEAEVQALHEVLVLTINGIAAGLRNTG